MYSTLRKHESARRWEGNLVLSVMYEWMGMKVYVRCKHSRRALSMLCRWAAVMKGSGDRDERSEEKRQKDSIEEEGKEEECELAEMASYWQ